MLRNRLAIPAIFMFGPVDREILRRANAARPLGFIAKPFSPSQVFNAIERALSHPAALQQAG